MRRGVIRSSEVLKQLETLTWNCFNILRAQVASSEFHVLLLLLSSYKDKLLKPDHKYQSDWRNTFLLNIQKDSFYSKLYTTYAPVLNSISDESILELVNLIQKIDQHYLENNFKEIFEYILKSIIDFQGKKSNESIQPDEISKLIVGIAGLKDNARVYNPFAGYASFGIYLNENQEYHGQELYKPTWAIGQLRLKAHKKSYSRNFKLDDSVKNWENDEKFDLILANPPVKMSVPRFEPYYSFGTSSSADVESFLTDRGIHSLSNNGKLITVFSLSFLFNGGRLAMQKKWLIDNNLIDTIITLPSDLLSNTSIPLCIMVFKKVSTRPGFIKFIDASTFFTKEHSKIKKLSELKVLELIDQDIENEFLKYVDVQKIYENNFNLSVGRYFLREIHGTQFTDFSSIIRGERVVSNKNMKQVNIRNLKDDVFDSILRSHELESTPVQRGAFRVINESCLLIATRWTSLKPTFFEYTGDPVVIPQSVVAIKLDESMINPIFLINEFSADYVEKQLHSYRVGAIQPMLRKDDLKKIVFKLPSIQEQNAKVSGITELSVRLKKIESEKQNILNGIYKDENESSTSFSHILGKPLLSIGSSLEIIQNALSKLDPQWQEFLISKHRQFTLLDGFDSISKNLKYIQELADKNTSLISVSNFELEEVHFLKFLSEFIKDEKKALSNNVSLELDIHEDIKKLMDNQVRINGDRQKLKIVLVNLLDNAKNHAFVVKNVLNKINIEILPFIGNEEEALALNYNVNAKKSYVEVKFSNTGHSFPKDFTLKDYVRKNFAAGKTRNKGLGGYEVNEIIKAHNEGKSALNIISNQDNTEYNTTISFIIPIL